MLARKTFILTAAVLLLAGAPRSETGTGSDCDRCHPEYGARMLDSVMHTGDLNGRQVNDCLDCHVTADQSGQECRIDIIVPMEKCFACHFDPRDLPLNPAGVVNTHYNGLHHLESGGLLCQDCHSSARMHGPDPAASQLPMTCEDCHGTIDEYPRSRDGLVLTSAGVPFGNVYDRYGAVVLISATGQEFAVPVLRGIRVRDSWKSAQSKQAMLEVDAHRENLECMACHADWAPPCVGCHAENGDAR